MRDILDLEIFPNVKEITESYAALRAYNKYFKHLPQYKDAYIVCVGDGVSPRTGAVFAFHTDREVFSIDPLMSWENRPEGITKIGKEGVHKVNRLTCVKARIEDWKIPDRLKGRPCVMIGVHSHATYDQCMVPVSDNGICPVLGIVMNSCCTEFDHVWEPDFVYDDWGIHSEKRTVQVWLEDGEMWEGPEHADDWDNVLANDDLSRFQRFDDDVDYQEIEATA